MARLREENEALRVRLATSNTVRKKKVVADPNKLFVNIKQVHRAQHAVGRANDPPAEESRSESPEVVRECSVIS